jgi:RNA polymerase sigma factor FliA
MSAPVDQRQFGQALTYAPRKPRDEAGDAIRQYLPLVRRIAWHVGGLSGTVDVEDLVQVGLLALVEAVGGAEDRGAPAFRQYLAQRLRGAMIDELRRHATASRGAMRRRRQQADAERQLAAELGRRPTERELAGRMGVAPETLRAADVRLEPLDDVYQDDLPWFASDQPTAFDALADDQQRAALTAAIAALPEREALVIQLYHVEELNLEEIGQVLGVGQARVCQIKAAAYGRLRKALGRR